MQDEVAAGVWQCEHCGSQHMQLDVEAIVADILGAYSCTIQRPLTADLVGGSSFVGQSWL